MPTPPLLLIKKKTLVPTNHQRVHLWRSDWKMVGRLENNVVERLFACFDKGGTMTHDSQFALFLKNNFGEGIYAILVFKKGKRGFYSFMKIEIKDKTFVRLKKNKTQDQLMKEQEQRELRKKQEELKKASNDPNKEREAQEEVDFAQENLDLTEEIMDEIKVKQGCSPYLKSEKPIYGVHQYKTWGDIKEQEQTNQTEVKLW